MLQWLDYKIPQKNLNRKAESVKDGHWMVFLYFIERIFFISVSCDQQLIHASINVTDET